MIAVAETVVYKGAVVVVQLNAPAALVAVK
jgi:hypothetical protein